jgi:hypothetical protein
VGQIYKSFYFWQVYFLKKIKIILRVIYIDKTYLNIIGIHELTLIHSIPIPITNTLVNPAKRTIQTLFVVREVMCSLWLFWVAPINRNYTC